MISRTLLSLCIILLNHLGLQLVQIDRGSDHLRLNVFIIVVQLQVVLNQRDPLFLLDLLQLLVPVVHHELLDAHVAAAHADDQVAVDHFGVDLLGPEVVLVVPDSHDGHGAVQPVDVVREQLVHDVPREGLVELAGLLLQLHSELLVACLGDLDPLGYVLQLLD